MAKQFKDFTFGKNKLSDIFKFVSADFDGNSDVPLAMDRNMEKGETNRYRVEANYYGDTWANPLQIELDIIKDICVYPNQDRRIISQSEIRQITRWLTSPHAPKWIHFEYEESDSDKIVYYFGWFSNIETWTISGEVYGLRLYFTCTTPFGFTDNMIDSKQVTTYDNMLVINDSDELENYCYPKINIHPNADGQIFICNLSDCNLLENGILSLTQSSYFDSMLDAIEQYAALHSYTVKYTGTGDFNILPLCNNTAVQFYFVNKYNNEIKCTAFYLEDTKEYRIIEGGFMFMNVKENLDIVIDCQRLQIIDSIGRMITYDELGISNADCMYWFRLINGNNSILLYGNADFTITHRESRKVGE